MYHLVIDLEMCKVPRDYRSSAYRYKNETIQIGAVLLDKTFKRIGSLSQYVHPEHGVIDPYIERLTGIDNSQVKNAPKLREAILHLIDWLGDREYHVYTWSNADWSQLMREMEAKAIDDVQIQSFMETERWADYQDVFTKRFDLSRAPSLEEALWRTELQPEGRLHDGLDDAVNTGALIEKLELNPTYQLIAYEGPGKPTERLTSPMGELLAGLDLQLT